MLALRASREWKVKPLEYFDWSFRDRALAEGLLLLEDSIGPDGIPWRDRLDPEKDGAFKVDIEYDFAAAARERFEQDLRDSNAPSEPGRILVVRDETEQPLSRYERIRMSLRQEPSDD